jgi:hypothetical protein
VIRLASLTLGTRPAELHVHPGSSVDPAVVGRSRTPKGEMNLLTGERVLEAQDVLEANRDAFGPTFVK